VNRTLRTEHPWPRATLLVAGLAAFAMALLGAGAPPARAQSTDALLDTLQHSGILYFWNEANPANGLIKDRSTAGSPASIAATGFGLSAICVGVDHGWIARPTAATRVLTTLNTFWTGPQGTATTGIIGYKGLFYHFLDMNTATRTWTSELSSIDTALLLAGVLDAKQYFNNLGDPTEGQIRALADSIERRVDWNFMRNFSAGVRMGWTPESGFSSFGQWTGYNEAMIMYIEAIGSPTHPVPQPGAWQEWTLNYSWQTLYGQTFLVCPPLFTHQYTQCWLDLRAMQDAYMAGKNSTYYINTQRATMAQRAYCIANPNAWTAYGDSLWGLTASDDPYGYNAHGAPPMQSDNGTITPTAAITSISYTPDLALPVIRNLWNSWRAQLWGPYGYVDAFNPSYPGGWVDTDVLGIDQGPIVLSIENYRTGAVWDRMRNNPDLAAGLAAAGFVYHSTGVGDGPPRGLSLSAVEPNPALATATISFALPASGRVTLDVFDVRGRHVLVALDGVRSAGEGRVDLATAGLAPGVYLVRLSTPAGVRTGRFVKVR
jgi:hypothetical protein